MSAISRRVPTGPRVRSLRATQLRRPIPTPVPSGWRRLSRIFSWSGWGAVGKGVATIATLATALAAVGALYMTSRTLDAARQQTALSEQGQYTDRFGRAVEQLGSEKVDIRLGGIYALERLARNSPRDAGAITRLLGTYVREKSPCGLNSTAPVSAELPRLPIDVAAALTVLSARDYHQTAPWADVTNACLDHRRLEAETLNNLDLDGANLASSNLLLVALRGVRLQHTNLQHTNLKASEWLGVLADGAQLDGADLSSAILHTSSFRDASLVGANLGGVYLDRPSFRDGGREAQAVPYADAALAVSAKSRRPVFVFANLTDASFHDAHLPDADFSSAQLDGANFGYSYLPNADFSEMYGSEHVDFAEQVRFDYADLSGASFQGRNMRRMSLVGANLSHANLRDTDLRGVDLSSTNLTGADLTDAKR